MTDNAVSGDVVDVAVKDAQHHGEGRSKYTSYLVEVKSPSNSACRRRYSDFQWLYEKLLEERAGCIIPIMKHTRALRANVRFSEELVNQRIEYLTTFLERVMNHPDLIDAPCLKIFLTADFTVWESAKKSHGLVIDDLNLSTDSDDLLGSKPPQESPPGGSGGRISNWMNKIRTKVALAGKNTQLESTPDDDIFNDVDAYINNLDVNIKILHKGAENLVKAMKQSSETMQQMSASFAEMGQYKLANDILVRTPSHTMFTKLGTNWNNLSKLGSFQESSATTKLEEPMDEMMRDVQSVKIAMTKRRELLYNYSRKAHLANTKTGQLDKLRESGATPDFKSMTLEGEINTLKEETTELWNEVETVSRRLSRDIERFKIEFREKMHSTMESFHSIQKEYAEKFTLGWAEVLPVLKPLETTSSDSAQATPASDEPITTTI